MLRPPPISTLFPYTTLFRSTILVIEDDRAMRSMIATCLHHCGHNVVVAQNGREGLERHSVETVALDRKSTRLNSSHTVISYAVFCLKKKKKKREQTLKK